MNRHAYLYQSKWVSLGLPNEYRILTGIGALVDGIIRLLSCGIISTPFCAVGSQVLLRVSLKEHKKQQGKLQ